jgi:hypothetical protein
MFIKLPIAPLVVAVAFASAACSQDTSDPQATPTPTIAQQCPVGGWRSSQVSASGSALGVTASMQGGSGASLTVSATGAVRADFTGMQPITYTVRAAGAELSGEIAYSGAISGNLDLAAATTSPSPTSTTPPHNPGTPPVGAPTPATSAPTPPPTDSVTGVWRPAGQVEWGQLRLTVRLTEPVAVTVIDNLPIGQVTSDQTTRAGNLVDIQPLLREGTYRCDGDDTLVVNAMSGGPNVTWKLQRTS